jgi:hypothetical protein
MMDPNQAPQGAPQEGPGGGDVMKEMAALMMQDAQKYEKLASAVPPEIGKPIAAIAQAIAQTVEGLGVVPKGGKPGGMAENPDTAGTNAQPVDPRMG